MKIELLTIGKNNFPFIEEGIQFYSLRINKYINFSIRYLPESKKLFNMPAGERQRREDEIFLREIKPGAFLILLDERGQQKTSLEFASFMQQLMNRGYRHIVFLMGGAYGVGEKIKQQAHEKLSLSRFTFPHELARLIFAEQLYRAFTLLKGEPYHHE